MIKMVNLNPLQNLRIMKLNTAISVAIILILISSAIEHSEQLECYVCSSQPDNKNKCAETVKTCDLAQDQCLTEVRWGSAPNWALTDQKKTFISKKCATKLECQEAISDKYHKCDRIWYNDWNCTTCCSGDKCNYYVTLAGTSIRPNIPTILLSGILTSIFFVYHRY